MMSTGSRGVMLSTNQERKLCLNTKIVSRDRLMVNKTGLACVSVLMPAGVWRVSVY